MWGGNISKQLEQNTGYYIPQSAAKEYSLLVEVKKLILSIINKINYGEECTKDGGRGNKKAAVRNEGWEVLRGVGLNG